MSNPDFTKTLTECDQYFLPDNHIKANNWRKYSEQDKRAAFAQAKRILEVYLGRGLYDPEDDDVYRDDYACYEQSLYILDSTPRQTSEGLDGVVNLVRDEEEASMKDTLSIGVSPDAKSFLAISKIKLVRG